jgi:hypothetical protein
MAALGGGHGAYTFPQIIDTFTTAYTAFRAAKHQSERIAGTSSNSTNDANNNNGQKAKVVIHTGNW